ncbi:hypothetical protein MTO96_005865 [Rhipicephalus appendiculatus]
MRPLTSEETRTFFDKLSKYISENIKLLIDRPDGTYCFRLHKDRVYYVSEKIMKLANNVARENLISMGTCFGKFTKSGKFHLHVTAPWITWHRMQNKRITESTNTYDGVVVYSMSDIPLGFGVAAKSTQECRRADPMTIVVFHQADVGEYIRSEDTLT